MTDPYIKALNAFSSAWKNAAAAYDNDEINSERCLQAFLYAKLRNKLKSEFKIFIEPKILKANHNLDNNADADEDDAKAYQKESHIDTIIAFGKNVILAIELKFNSRGKPKKQSLQKDLASLSHMLENDTRIIIKRIYGKEIELNSTAKTNIALGIFYADKPEPLKIDYKFFGIHRPAKRHNPIQKWLDRNAQPEGVEGGRRSRSLPHRLFVFGAGTSNKSEVDNTKTKVIQICNPSYMNNQDFKQIQQ
jgi:hypothetical protein